jgi:hypothetical protein
MAVIVVPKFTKAEIKALMDKRREMIKKAILLNLKRVGETFVTRCRENRTYTDRTGNLRSSIGYVILHNGIQMNENFKKFPATKSAETKKGSGESGGKPEADKDGVAVAKSMIDEVKGKYPKGFVLICVAGMEYAAAVEFMGYDVISNGAILAEAELKLALQRISKKIK